MWLTSLDVIFWCWSCSQNLPYNAPVLTHASPTLFNAGCKAPGWRFSSGIHSLMTSIFWVWLACRRSLYVPLLCPWLRWLLVHRQAKMELIIFWQDCCSLNEDTIDLFNHYISWELADVMTESPHRFWNCNRNLRHRCLSNGLPEILVGALYNYLHPLCESGELWKLMLLFMMKGMVWHSVWGTHKVMTTLILVVLVWILPEIDRTGKLLLWSLHCNLLVMPSSWILDCI